MLLGHSGQLALQAGHFLVARRTGADEGAFALAIHLAFPASQQVVPDAQFAGDLGTTDTRRARLLNSPALELHTELPSLRHEHSLSAIAGLLESVRAIGVEP